MNTDIDKRISAILTQAGMPLTLKDVFSGNVKITVERRPVDHLP